MYYDDLIKEHTDDIPYDYSDYYMGLWWYVKEIFRLGGDCFWFTPDTLDEAWDLLEPEHLKGMQDCGYLYVKPYILAIGEKFTGYILFSTIHVPDPDGRNSFEPLCTLLMKNIRRADDKVVPAGIEPEEDEEIEVESPQEVKNDIPQATSKKEEAFYQEAEWARTLPQAEYLKWYMQNERKMKKYARKRREGR